MYNITSDGPCVMALGPKYFAFSDDVSGWKMAERDDAHIFCSQAELDRANHLLWEYGQQVVGKASEK